MPLKNTKIFNLLRLLQRAFGRYKKQILALSIFGFLSSILEGIGINMIIPLFSLIDPAPSAELDIISGAVRNLFIFFHIPYTVKFLLIFITVIFLVKAVLLFLSRFISIKITANYEHDIRSKILNSTLKSNWQNLSKQKVGHLDQTLIMDINNSSAMLSHISSAILIIGNLGVYSLVVINVSPLIALLTMLSGMGIFILFKPFFYKNKMLAEKTAGIYKQMAHFINESIIGMKTIKAMFLEQSVTEKGTEYFNTLKMLNIKSAILRVFTSSLLQPIGLVFVIGIFAWFYKVQGFNFASFAVVVYAINKLFSYIQLAESEAHSIASLAPFVASTVQYQEGATKDLEKDSGKNHFKFQDTVSFKNVSFGYNSDQHIVQNLSFTIKKGQIMGIVGPSGAGKTTVVDLLLRLFKPTSGTIFLDSVDSSEVALAEWRANIGYVSQDIFLLNDTIENNIRFYNPSISPEGMIQAAQTAHCLEFIKKLPQGFLTVVGERGMVLSGGQRQRIALARVLARRPSILVLDEATSALDSESETMIQRAIEELRGKMTVVIIAHRLSTVLISDTVIALENGKIIEEGAPEVLLKDHESYFSKAYNLK